MAQLDHERERIQEDLRGCGRDVRCDDIYEQLYASDGSIYEIKPLESSARALRPTWRLASNMPPRNGSPSMRAAQGRDVGESLGPGLVVDFSRYLARVKYTGRRPFACSRAWSTSGSTRISARPAGSSVPIPATPAPPRWAAWLRSMGRQPLAEVRIAGQHVVSMQVVLADGTVIEAGREPLEAGASVDPNPANASWSIALRASSPSTRS